MDYASKGVGNTALGLSIGSLGAQLLGGGLSNIFGGSGGNQQYVSRETFDLSMQLAQANTAKSLVEADLASEKKMVEVFNSLNDKINKIRDEQTEINSAQAVFNAGTNSQLAVLTNQTAQLMGMTKLVIPNANICPGWSTATTTTTT